MHLIFSMVFIIFIIHIFHKIYKYAEINSILIRIGQHIPRIITLYISNF